MLADTPGTHNNSVLKKRGKKPMYIYLFMSRVKEKQPFQNWKENYNSWKWVKIKLKVLKTLGCLENFDIHSIQNLNLLFTNQKIFLKVKHTWSFLAKYAYKVQCLIFLKNQNQFLRFIQNHRVKFAHNDNEYNKTKQKKKTYCKRSLKLHNEILFLFIPFCIKERLQKWIDVR